MTSATPKSFRELAKEMPHDFFSLSGKHDEREQKWCHRCQVERLADKWEQYLQGMPARNYCAKEMLGPKENP